MKTKPIKITIYSEQGCLDQPSMIDISMDGSKPDCPITFWQDSKPVFSMGSDEILEFVEALQDLDPS